MRSFAQNFLIAAVIATLVFVLLHISLVNIPLWVILLPLSLFVGIFFGIPFVVGILGLVFLVLYFNYCIFFDVPIKQNKDTEKESNNLNYINEEEDNSDGEKEE